MITISGPGVTNPISVHADTQADLFSALLDQVNWMAGRSPDPMDVTSLTLGPKYELVVYAGGSATARYELYPLASGGPRALFPAAQPNTTGHADSWYYATVSMPDVLAAAGVPIAPPSAGPDTVEVGNPGSLGNARPTPSVPKFSLATTFGTERRILMFSLAAAVGVLVMVFGAARRSHRRWG
jgi:hypothetical protein